MKIFLSILIVLIANSTIGAQNQFIDTGFGTHNGYTVTASLTGTYDLWLKNIVEYNGDIYATNFNFNDDGYIFKYDSNGIVDTTFGTNGYVDINNKGYLASSSSDHSRGLFTMTSIDNKLLLVDGAYTENYPNEFKVMITKMNLDGTLDSTYGTNGQFLLQLPLGMSVIGAELTQNDEVVVIGYNIFIDSSGMQNIYITKIDSMGILDTSFGNNGLIELTYDYQTYNPMQAIVQNQSVFMLFFDPFGDSYITKYDLDTMNYDSTFGNNGTMEIDNFPQEESTQSFMVDDNNTIYVTGSRSLGMGLKFELYVGKYNHGILDTGFGTNGVVNFQLIDNTNSTTNSHSIERHDDKILVMGTSYNWDAESYEKTFFAQFNLDGSLDTDFGLNGIIINYLFDKINVAYDYLTYGNTIITAGSCPNGPNPQRPCLVKYIKNLNLDTVDIGAIKNVFYPNPVDEILTFNSYENIERIEVIDVTGKIIDKYKINQNNIDLGHLKSGVYYLKVFTTDGTFNVSIVKK